MAYTAIVKSIKEVDLSLLQIPQVAVYNNPEELRRDIRKYTNLVWFPRGKEDVPALVGVYL